MSALVEVRAAELEGMALDWAVARAVGQKLEKYDGEFYLPGNGGSEETWGEYLASLKAWAPSTDWAQGGPLIEKYGVSLWVLQDDGPVYFVAGECRDDGDGRLYPCCSWTEIVPALHFVECPGRGPTHLIAACRAIVAAKLGDTVSVPAELVAER